MKITLRTYALFSLVAVIAAMIAAMAMYEHFPVPPARQIQPPESFINDFDEFQAYNPPQSLPALEVFDLEGHVMNLKEFKGKWRLINFWATWCPPCVEEIPSLLSLKKTKGGKAFDVVFISLDSVENADSFRKRMNQVNLPPAFHTFYVQDINVWEKLSIKGVPISLIVDPKGRIYFKLTGDTDWTGKGFLAFLDDLLNNQ